jgi:hypothetical protein
MIRGNVETQAPISDEETLVTGVITTVVETEIGITTATSITLIRVERVPREIVEMRGIDTEGGTGTDIGIRSGRDVETEIEIVTEIDTVGAGNTRDPIRII